MVSGWTIKREFSIGDLIAVAASAVAIFGAWYSIDRRLSVVEEKLIQQAKIDDRQDQTTERLNLEIKSLLTEIRADVRDLRREVKK